MCYGHDGFYSTTRGAFSNVYIVYKCTVSRQLDYFSFYEFSIIAADNV